MNPLLAFSFCILFLVTIPKVAGNGMPRKYVSSILDSTGRRRGTPRDDARVVGAISSDSQENDLIWPMPASVAHGGETVTLNKDFTFACADGKPAPETLAQAFSRYYDIIFKQHTLYQGKSSSYGTPVLDKLLVDLASSDEEEMRYRIRSETFKKSSIQNSSTLVYNHGTPTAKIRRKYVGLSLSDVMKAMLQYGVDESYTLGISVSSPFSAAYLQAATVYGALRGLETFSQLVVFSFSARLMQISNTPHLIKDHPRFPYRGLLIDTSRHYQPVENIKRILDSMAFAKLNVLHWHIVDEQSFPIEIPSYPGLWNGAYTYGERYTMDDAREIVEYARLRGIHVMPELDVPGHGESWGVGYPDLWPSPQCTEPLDVSNQFTFDVIEGIIQDFRKVFPFKFAHLGGDEVDTDCWEASPHIQTWLKQSNFSAKDAYADFVTRAQAIAQKHGYEPVNWEETFNTFPLKLSKDTVVHNWLQGGVCAKAVKWGFRCIMSDQSTWYLDHLDVPWDKFYNTEPLLGITNSEEENLVIGGEVCMWGETADASNVLQTIWPRAAAAAERLWSPLKFTDQGALPALKRLQNFRCLLDQRGIPAAPVLYNNKPAYGRTSPYSPDSCYRQ